MSLVDPTGRAVSSKKPSVIVMPGSEIVCVIEEETVDGFRVSYPFKVARTLQGAMLVDYIAGVQTKEIIIEKKWVIHKVDVDLMAPALVERYVQDRALLEK